MTIKPRAVWRGDDLVGMSGVAGSSEVAWPELINTVFALREESI